MKYKNIMVIMPQLIESSAAKEYIFDDIASIYKEKMNIIKVFSDSVTSQILLQMLKIG